MTTEKILENSEKLLEKLADLSERELSDLVKLHNRKYFEENDPEITDEAFDKLVEALRFLNPRASVLSQIGHKDLSDSASRFGHHVVHRRPMLSLDKCYDDKSFLKWAQKISGDLVAMPKIDGVACSIIYSVDGNLLEASTRGDGRVGDNITKNALLISDLPAQLPKTIVAKASTSKEGLEIRGEVFLPISHFEKKFANEFASPRNLAAGFVKLKEADRTKINFLRFFPYDIRGSHSESEEEKFTLLERLGFSMMPWKIVPNDEQAMKIYVDLLNQRSRFDYEIDGVVYRANALRDQARLGETSHHPRYAIAYKFQGETGQAKLLRVEWSVARSGIITPIAVFEPVFVSGANVTRASLHNMRIFSELDLREQSLLEINRRGGVIPYLERVLSKKGDKIVPPKHCPSCGGPVERVDDFLFCKNPAGCEEVTVGKFIHFSHVLGIEGFGHKIIRKLFHKGLLKKLGDVFRLNVESLLDIERMGKVLAQKLVDEINKKREIDLALFIHALGIHEIGANVSELLADNFHTLSKLRHLTLDDLVSIHGVGLSIATAFVEGLKENADEIDDVLQEITVKDHEATNLDADQTHPLFGKSVLFTGKMAHLDRKAAQLAVKKIGGKAPSAMSKSIDYLVIGDEGSPLLGSGKKSTKQKEAEKLIADGGEIKIISETEFLKMLH